MFEFREKLGEDYHDVLDYIDEEGTIYFNEREQAYKEAEPITIEVTEPIFDEPEEVLPQYAIQRLTSEFILQYAYNVAHGLPEPGDWAYCYGTRLAEGKQVENIVSKLKNNPDCRQATCVLYRPSDTEMETPPCMCVVDFKIRVEKLRVFGWLRSNDMENGYPSNYFDMLMLANRISEELNRPIDRITTRSESAHVYRWSR